MKIHEISFFVQKIGGKVQFLFKKPPTNADKEVALTRYFAESGWDETSELYAEIKERLMRETANPLEVLDN